MQSHSKIFLFDNQRLEEVKINSINYLYLIIGQMNRYFEDDYGYFNSDDYDKKYIKIKFNSDDNLPLKKSARNS